MFARGCWLDALQDGICGIMRYGGIFLW